MEGLSQRSAANRRELVESREEILIGEVIAWMADAECPVIGIASDVDYQRIRFRTPKDPVLYSVLVAVDRIHSSKHQASLVLRGETRAYPTTPEAMLETSRKLERAAAKASEPNGLEFGRHINGLFATVKKSVSLSELLTETGRSLLGRALDEALTVLRKTLTEAPTTRGETPS